MEEFDPTLHTTVPHIILSRGHHVAGTIASARPPNRPGRRHEALAFVHLEIHHGAGRPHDACNTPRRISPSAAVVIGGLIQHIEHVEISIPCPLTQLIPHYLSGSSFDVIVPPGGGYGDVARRMPKSRTYAVQPGGTFRPVPRRLPEKLCSSLRPSTVAYSPVQLALKFLIFSPDSTMYCSWTFPVTHRYPLSAYTRDAVRGNRNCGRRAG